MLKEFYDYKDNINKRKSYYSNSTFFEPIIEFYSVQYSYEYDIYTDISINRIYNKLKSNYLNLNKELNDYIDNIDTYHNETPLPLKDILVSNMKNVYDDISGRYKELVQNTNDYKDFSNSWLEDISSNINTINKLYYVYYKIFSVKFVSFNNMMDKAYYGILNRINRVNKIKLKGSKILIKTYYSNSIAIKVLINYNSYYYRNIELDRIFLDITIPDLIAPSIIFTNKDLFNIDIIYDNTQDNRTHNYLQYIKEINDIPDKRIYDKKTDIPLIIDFSYIDYSLNSDNEIITYTVKDKCNNTKIYDFVPILIDDPTIEISYNKERLFEKNADEDIIPLIRTILGNLKFLNTKYKNNIDVSLNITIGGDTILNNFHISKDATNNNAPLLEFSKIEFPIIKNLTVKYIITNIYNNQAELDILINMITRIIEPQPPQIINICSNAKCDIIKYIKQDNYKLGSLGSNSRRIAIIARYYSRK